eukprot:scaffold1150_cov152-Amphora_coffeaeformis.AAC.9
MEWWFCPSTVFADDGQNYHQNSKHGGTVRQPFLRTKDRTTTVRYVKAWSGGSVRQPFLRTTDRTTTLRYVKAWSGGSVRRPILRTMDRTTTLFWGCVSFPDNPFGAKLQYYQYTIPLETHTKCKAVLHCTRRIGAVNVVKRCVRSDRVRPKGRADEFGSTLPVEKRLIRIYGTIK